MNLFLIEILLKLKIGKHYQKNRKKNCLQTNIEYIHRNNMHNNFKITIFTCSMQYCFINIIFKNSIKIN